MEKNNNINPDSMIPMYKQIVNLLNEKIEKGELKPGDKLPSEAELMEAYSVSRITIRSAISELEEDGLVIRSRGKGTFIASKKAMYSADDTVGFTHSCQQEGKKKRNGGRTEKQRGKAESIFVISFDPECLFGSD